MAAGLQSSFLAFCDSQKKGSDKASDKVVKKIFTDCGVFKALKATTTDMDISVAAFKAKEKIRGDITYAQFCLFLTRFCEEAAKKGRVPDAAASEEELKAKIAESKPTAHGATAASKDAATSRLTDAKGYTGSHKERFDASTGRGRGRAGRVDLVDPKAAEGYVGAYKGMGSYEKKQ